MQLHRTILQRQEANLWNYGDRVPTLHAEEGASGGDTPRTNRLATQLLSFALGKSAGRGGSDAGESSSDELNAKAVSSALKSGGATELAQLFDAHFGLRIKKPAASSADASSVPQKADLFAFLLQAKAE